MSGQNHSVSIASAIREAAKDVCSTMADDNCFCDPYYDLSTGQVQVPEVLQRTCRMVKNVQIAAEQLVNGQLKESFVDRLSASITVVQNSSRRGAKKEHKSLHFFDKDKGAFFPLWNKDSSEGGVDQSYGYFGGIDSDAGEKRKRYYDGMHGSR